MKTKIIIDEEIYLPSFNNEYGLEFLGDATYSPMCMTLYYRYKYKEKIFYVLYSTDPDMYITNNIIITDDISVVTKNIENEKNNDYEFHSAFAEFIIPKADDEAKELTDEQYSEFKTIIENLKKGYNYNDS